MNVIETVKKILTDCELMDEFNQIHVDYTETEESPLSAGLFANGAVKTGEDIIGNPKYRMPFTLYTGLQSVNDYDRLKNSDFLLRLTYYMNGQKDIPITENLNGTDYNGIITDISGSNALLFDYPTGTPDLVRYQLQIQVNYRIEIE